MEQLVDLFRFNSTESIIAGSLFFLFGVQLFFLLFFYNRPYLRHRKIKKENITVDSENWPSVSVIIIATDEHINLEQNLPAVLTQDYPDYEVIVVNNGLTDDTDILLKGLKLEYPHLYHTFLPKHSDEEAIRQKLAYTIGIKAAKKDILLFTGADTMPMSDQWVASMMQEMKAGKDIVLGYCCFEKTTEFINRIARFDNLLSSVQNISATLLNKPIMGMYRNIAYRKNLFFENKGFSSVLNYKHCESLFLNAIMTEQNTTACLNPQGFVEIKMDSFSKWEQIKLYSDRVRKNIRNFRFLPIAFSFEAFCRLLFYFSSVFMIIFSIMQKSWGILIITLLLFFLRLIIGLVVINHQSKHFKAGKFYFSYILMDVLQPFYNLYFKVKT